MISELTFAQYQLLSYVREDAESCLRGRLPARGSATTSAVSCIARMRSHVLMRVNLLKRMESSVERLPSRRWAACVSSCADILDRLAALDALPNR